MLASLFGLMLYLCLFSLDQTVFGFSLQAFFSSGEEALFVQPTDSVQLLQAALVAATPFCLESGLEADFPCAATTLPVAQNLPTQRHCPVYSLWRPWPVGAVAKKG